MDQSNQNPINNTGFNSVNNPEKKSYGALVAVVIILFLIVIGGLYFLGQRMSDHAYDGLNQNANTSDDVTKALNNQGSSDDLNSIEADIKATNIEGIDQGAAAIEAEINQ